MGKKVPAPKTNIEAIICDMREQNKITALFIDTEVSTRGHI